MTPWLFPSRFIIVLHTSSSKAVKWQEFLRSLWIMQSLHHRLKSRVVFRRNRWKGYKIQTLVENLKRSLKAGNIQGVPISFRREGKKSVWYDEKLPDYANVRRVWKFWHKKIFHCNHAEWVNYDDLKIDVSARLHYVGHYGDCIVQWAHGWTRILGENIILSFVLLYSVGIISGVRMSVKTLGNSGGLLVWHYTHLAKTLSTEL